MATEIQWSAFAVKQTITTHASTANQASGAGEEIAAALANVGALLKNAGEEEKFQQVREATKEMIEAHHSLGTHHDALSLLNRHYVATGDTTDFTRAIAEYSQQVEEANLYDVASDPLLRHFDEESGAAAPEDELIDDEIAIAGETGRQVARNTTCPLSGKPILELEEPVADQMNFVYEKDAILGYFKSLKRAVVECPVAGTTHRFSAKDLKPASAVIKEQKRAKAAGGRKKRDDSDAIELD